MTWARRLIYPHMTNNSGWLWLKKRRGTRTHQFLTCFILTKNPSRIETLPSPSTIANSTLTKSPFELPHIDQFDSNFPANNLCHGHRSYANLGGLGSNGKTVAFAVLFFLKVGWHFFRMTKKGKNIESLCLLMSSWRCNPECFLKKDLLVNGSWPKLIQRSAPNDWRVWMIDFKAIPQPHTQWN